MCIKYLKTLMQLQFILFVTSSETLSEIICMLKLKKVETIKSIPVKEEENQENCDFYIMPSCPLI